MPRHVRVIEGIYGAIENVLYAIGDAEDFIDRERINFRELIDGVADGRLSAGEAKRQLDLAFANASKQIAEARGLASGDAMRAGFPHLHESLIPKHLTIPGFRIIKPLPGGAA